MYWNFEQILYTLLTFVNKNDNVPQFVNKFYTELYFVTNSTAMNFLNKYNCLHQFHQFVKKNSTELHIPLSSLYLIVIKPGSLSDNIAVILSI